MTKMRGVAIFSGEVLGVVLFNESVSGQLVHVQKKTRMSPKQKISEVHLNSIQSL